jgi:hypothetical protein
MIREESDAEPLAEKGMERALLDLSSLSLALPLDAPNDTCLRPGGDRRELPKATRLPSEVKTLESLRVESLLDVASELKGSSLESSDKDDDGSSCQEA